MIQDNDLLKKRIDELEFISHKTKKRAVNYDELATKVFDLDTERKLLETKMY